MDFLESISVHRIAPPEVSGTETAAELVDRASTVVQRYGGTVDKFTGDGIMAVFADTYQRHPAL